MAVNMTYGPNNTAQSRYTSYINNGIQPGNNGVFGFKSWECYMLIKYGKPGQFNVGGDYEYLIELPMYPDQVTESIGANWQSQNVLGRSSPLSAYVNTDLKSVSFELTLHRDFLTGSYSIDAEKLHNIGGNVKKNQYPGFQKQTPGGPFDTRTWYVSANKMLQMSCYPQYTDNGLIPPTTYFIFGQMLLKGFVKSYSTTWKKPILNTFYGWNTVSIQMDCYPDTIMSARDLILNYSSASTQNTYNQTFPAVATSNSNVMTRGDMNQRHNYRTNATLGGYIADTGN